MKRFTIFLSVLLCCVIPFFASAEELVSASDQTEPESEVSDNVVDVEEVREVIEYEFILNQPITTIEITEEDYNNSVSGQTYVSGSAYQGSFNSTALNYFTGVMLNNLGKDYVAYRGSQYVYFLFFGDEITYNGSSFVGSGIDYVSYSSYDGTFTRGTDDLSINDNNTVVYSNVDDKFANLVEVKYCEETRATGIVTASIFLLLCLLWFFKR